MQQRKTFIKILNTHIDLAEIVAVSSAKSSYIDKPNTTSNIIIVLKSGYVYTSPNLGKEKAFEIHKSLISLLKEMSGEGETSIIDIFR